MIKILKRWSDSNVILLTEEELKAHGLKTGDILDIEIYKIKKPKYKKLPTNDDNVELLKKIKKEVSK